MGVGFPLVLIVVIVGVVLLMRQPDPARRAAIVKRIGFGVMAATTAFFVLFVAGETFQDPGGWAALGLVASWLVPLAAFGALAWFRPDWTIWLVSSLVIALIAMSVWFAVAPDAWRAFEDRNGPIRTIITFAVAAIGGMLGLKRTRAAGVLLLALAVVPMAIASFGSLRGSGSLAVATSAPFVAGVLYLISAFMGGSDRRTARRKPSLA